MTDFESDYVAGGLHPVHLGDVLDSRYHIFRKLGVGSQSTVWLARDASTSERRFVAVKVFRASDGEANKRLDQILQHKISHQGHDYVETTFDSFTIQGPNGSHHCSVLEPLGRNFSGILEDNFDRRWALQTDDELKGSPTTGDPWSVIFAKKACWQILMGLDYLHKKNIAHRDLRPGNICIALQDDLSTMTENQIQKTVWAPESDKILSEDNNNEKYQGEGDAEGGEEENDDQDEENSDTGVMIPKKKKDRESEREQMKSDRGVLKKKGDELAMPHSEKWNAANLLNSRRGGIFPVIEEEAKPLQPGLPLYTMGWEPLKDGFDLKRTIHEGKPFRLVLSDLGFACTFQECQQRTLINNPVYMPPEHLMGLQSTYKADIFSMGLTFWIIVMLKDLIYPMYSEEKLYMKNRQIHDFVLRLGSFPPRLRPFWRDADKFLDSDGHALDTREYDEKEYGEINNFEYGDIWVVGRAWKPLDMSEKDLKVFIDLIQKMLQFEPELRPSTSELLQHEWFKSQE